MGDVVRLRKPHPCGSYEWAVVRIGADIGLRCLKCKHRVLLRRTEAERRLKGFLSRALPPDGLNGFRPPEEAEAPGVGPG